MYGKLHATEEEKRRWGGEEGERAAGREGERDGGRECSPDEFKLLLVDFKFCVKCM